MDFAETDEQLMLREAVSNIARRYGHEYFVEQARTGQKGQELWDDLAAHGFLGVNLPTEHGGGGMGIAELAIVEEECSAAGCPLLPFEDGLRHHRARRRVEQPSDQHHRHPRR
jgi:alkylation response protein AidB-like acyl-CoA dehydrogenase